MATKTTTEPETAPEPPKTTLVVWDELGPDGDLRQQEVEVPGELELPPMLPVGLLMTLIKRDIGNIAKERKTDTGTQYNFRGIDDVYDHFHAPLAKWGVLPVPRVEKLVYDTKTWTENGRQRTQTVTRLHLFVDYTGPRGDKITADAWAEAQDMGDKAISKAMSVAFRTVMIQTFTVPVKDAVTSVEIENNNDLRDGGPAMTQEQVNAHVAAVNALVRRLRDLPAWDVTKRAAFVNRAAGRKVDSARDLEIDELEDVQRQLNQVFAGVLAVDFQGEGDSFEAVFVVDDESDGGDKPVPPPDITAEGELHAPEPDFPAEPTVSPGSGEEAIGAEQERRREELADKARAEVAEQVAAAAPKLDEAATQKIIDQVVEDVSKMDKPKLVEALAAFNLGTAGAVAALRSRLIDARVEQAGIS